MPTFWRSLLRSVLLAWTSVPSIDDPALVDRLEAVDAGEQRRLARAGAADDGDHLALVDGQVDALQDLQRAEGFADVFDLNHWGTTVFRDTRQVGRWEG